MPLAGHFHEDLFRFGVTVLKAVSGECRLTGFTTRPLLLFLVDLQVGGTSVVESTAGAPNPPNKLAAEDAMHEPVSCRTHLAKHNVTTLCVCPCPCAMCPCPCVTT
jgi:hypothetical protein